MWASLRSLLTYLLVHLKLLCLTTTFKITAFKTTTFKTTTFSHICQCQNLSKNRNISKISSNAQSRINAHKCTKLDKADDSAKFLFKITIEEI